MEILFKAQRKDTQEWVEGNLFIDKDLEIYQIQGWTYYSDETGTEREPFGYDIIPETICQYIGFNDKNDVKIFNNDIIREYNTSTDYDEGDIFWHNTMARYLRNSKNNCCSCPNLWKANADTYEVIGNKFDKEDIKGEEQDEQNKQSTNIDGTEENRDC